ASHGRRHSTDDRQMAEGGRPGGGRPAPSNPRVTPRGCDHPSHDGAKLPFDLAGTIPRDRLRPHYGDGFWGAPLLPCRPSKTRWPDHGGDGAQGEDTTPTTPTQAGDTR